MWLITHIFLIFQSIPPKSTRANCHFYREIDIFEQVARFSQTSAVHI